MAATGPAAGSCQEDQPAQSDNVGVIEMAAALPRPSKSPRDFPLGGLSSLKGTRKGTLENGLQPGQNDTPQSSHRVGAFVLSPRLS